MTDQPERPEPGQQLEGESAQAFEAFRIYLGMGSARSTAKVARQCGKQKSQMDRWSSRHRWVERVREYDGAVVQSADVERKEALVQAARRQAQEAEQHARATALVPDELLRRIEEKPELLRELDLEQLLQLAPTMARAHNRAIVTERLALGMTTDQPGEALPRSMAEEEARRLSDDELDAKLAGVDELAKQRARRAAAQAAGG